MQLGGGRGEQGLGSWCGWGTGVACVMWQGDAGEVTGDAVEAPRLLQGQARNAGRDPGWPEEGRLITSRGWKMGGGDQGRETGQ